MGNQNRHENSTWYWKIMLLCCCLSGAVSGMIIHTRGVFYAPASVGIGVSATKFATYTTYGSLAGVLAMPLVTKLFNEKSLRVVLSSYMLMFCGSSVLMGFATEMWQCYAIGILQGLVSSFLTVYPIAYIIKNWFVKNRGLMTGIATMFAGLFSSVMNMVLSFVLGRIGWRKTYILLGIVAFCIAEIPILLFGVKNPSDIGLRPYGSGNEGLDTVAKTKQKASMNKALFLSMIPVIVLTVAFYMSTGYNQHLSNFAQTIGFTATIGASLISVCMLGNTLFKLLLGFLNDHIGVYKTSVLTISTMAVGMLVLVLEPSTVIPLYAASIFLGQATAFIVVQIPLLLSVLYPDQREYERCLSTVMMVGSLTSAGNALLINCLYSVSGSYRLGQSVSFCALIFCDIMIFVLWNRTRMRNRRVSKEQK